MNKPHIHAELIKQWADGAEIEYYFKNNWMLDNNPSWHVGVIYRVKPAPVVQWITVNKEGYAGDIHMVRSTALRWVNKYDYKLMRLEIDPVTFAATCVLENV